MIPATLNPAKLIKAFHYALSGLGTAFRRERSFRQEVVIAVILIPLALWLGKTGIERALLAASVLLVLTVELLNTTVEILVERISSERHPLSGWAKDVGGAAVLMAIATMALTWGLVLTG